MPSWAQSEIKAGIYLVSPFLMAITASPCSLIIVRTGGTCTGPTSGGLIQARILDRRRVPFPVSVVTKKQTSTNSSRIKPESGGMRYIAQTPGVVRNILETGTVIAGTRQH